MVIGPIQLHTIIGVNQVVDFADRQVNITYDNSAATMDGSLDRLLLKGSHGPIGQSDMAPV